MRGLAMGFALLLLGGCAHSIHEYAVADAYPPHGEAHGGRTIEARGEQFVVLSFAFDTDYADEAYRQLLASCPDGDIVGINTRYSTSLSFFSYTNKIVLQATCLDGRQ